MTRKEVIDTLEIAKAEVEWNYPLDYAIAIDQAIGYIKAYDEIIVDIPAKEIDNHMGYTAEFFAGRMSGVLDMAATIQTKVKEIENDVKVGDTVQS